MSDKAERLGELIFEMEREGTIAGKPLPDSNKLEQSDWYTEVAAQMLRILEQIDHPWYGCWWKET